MALTKKQKKDWEMWILERPENVRKVAKRIVPWKQYVQIEIDDFAGNIYSVISYDEAKDGRITLTCEKSNEDIPSLFFVFL